MDCACDALKGFKFYFGVIVIKENDREYCAPGASLVESLRAVGYDLQAAIADLIDNSSSIVEHGKEFVKIYLYEKADMLKAMRDGNPELLARCEACLRESINKLDKV